MIHSSCNEDNQELVGLCALSLPAVAWALGENGYEVVADATAALCQSDDVCRNYRVWQYFTKLLFVATQIDFIFL